MNVHITDGDNPIVTLEMTLDQASRVLALLGQVALSSTPIVDGTTTYTVLEEALGDRNDVTHYSLEDSFGNSINQVINFKEV